MGPGVRRDDVWMEPGDAVFFHMLTLHGAGGVGRGRRRRVVSFRFMGDDTTFAPRPWRTSPPFTGLEKELAKGAARARAKGNALPVPARQLEDA